MDRYKLLMMIFEFTLVRIEFALVFVKFFLEVFFGLSECVKEITMLLIKFHPSGI